MALQLTASEQAALARLETNGSPSDAQRAAIILRSSDGISATAIARELGLSPGQVYYWRSQWARRKLGIFGQIPASEAEPVGEQPPAATPEAPRPGIDVPRLPLTLSDTIGLQPDDLMAEAGRKVLHYHFERMLFHEPGVRLGEDIEHVHDMRVATRRMRSAFRLFAPFFDEKTVRPLVRGLRRTARALGAVRDLDVFREKAGRFLAEHPDLSLDPLFSTWQADYDAARQALLAELDSKRFARFVERFQTFVSTPGMGTLSVSSGDGALTNRVRYVVPRLIYEHYERVRAYETMLDGASLDTLHALRIEFKRLRYAVEFFAEVLGPEASLVIKEIKIMQDHLGDLNDTRVALQTLEDFISQHWHAHSGIPRFLRENIAGVLAYADAKAAEQKHLLETFPQAWANFNREEVRRSLALAVAAL
jgi:CHAD domain-containing protein